MKQVRKFLRTYQELAVTVTILVGLLIGVFLGIIPAVKKIVVLRQDTSELIQLNASLSTKVSILDAMDEDTSKRYLTELAVAVPQDKSLTSVFSTIDGLAAVTGVALSDFTLTKPGTLATASAAKLTKEEQAVGSSLLPFTLTVTGTYNQIHDFIDRAIHVRRFFRIRQFDLTFSEGEIVSARMGMDAFYAVIPNKLGSAEQRIEQLTPEDDQTIEKIMEFPVLSQNAEVPGSGAVQPTESSSREDPFSP